ncbi:hypothetical protein HDV05_001580 [Chytridiales sp. JEL 0842]|nr:hypothetical protein HDV05_001580 [Chytridiales sp. JEL 0842]
MHTILMHRIDHNHPHEPIPNPISWYLKTIDQRPTNFHKRLPDTIPVTVPATPDSPNDTILFITTRLDTHRQSTTTPVNPVLGMSPHTNRQQDPIVNSRSSLDASDSDEGQSESTHLLTDISDNVRITRSQARKIASSSSTPSSSSFSSTSALVTPETLRNRRLPSISPRTTSPSKHTLSPSPSPITFSIEDPTSPDPSTVVYQPNCTCTPRCPIFTRNTTKSALDSRLPHRGHDITPSPLGTPLSKTDLLRYVDMPPWYPRTPFILGSYRQIQHSFRGCWESLGYIHNETGNIWTHLLGGFYFAGLMWVTYGWWMPTHGGGDLGDKIAFFAFHISAIICLTSSSCFHLFCCHSQQAHRNCLKADYLGVVFLILGSFIPIIYYGFYCHPTLRVFYLSLLTLLSLATISFNLSSRFSGFKYSKLRTSMFIVLGASASIPILHAIILNGIPYIQKSMSVSYIVLQGFIFFLGALIFMFQVPERWWPGMFDLWGNSHNIWHVLILVASSVHYVGMLRAFSWWKGLGEGGCEVVDVEGGHWSGFY